VTEGLFTPLGTGNYEGISGGNPHAEPDGASFLSVIAMERQRLKQSAWTHARREEPLRHKEHEEDLFNSGISVIAMERQRLKQTPRVQENLFIFCKFLCGGLFGELQ
jgi:hypothetical protein